MKRHPGLACPEHIGEVAHALLALTQALDHLQASLISKGAEEPERLLTFLPVPRATRDYHRWMSASQDSAAARNVSATYGGGAYRVTAGRPAQDEQQDPLLAIEGPCSSPSAPRSPPVVVRW